MGTEVIQKSVKLLFFFFLPPNHRAQISVIIFFSNMWLLHRSLLFSLKTSDVHSEGNFVMSKLFHCLYGHLFQSPKTRD